MRISDEQLEHWRRHGYVVVPGYLTASQVDTALANVHKYFPTAAEYEAAPRRFDGMARPGWIELPFVDDALNDLAVHPDLVDFMERAVGTADLRLTQSLLWAKYPGIGDDEQDLHVDFSNNTLAFPSGDPGFLQVPSILYLTDVTVELGPTFVVSREHTRGDPLLPVGRKRAEHPELYAHERAVVCSAGSLLLYDMRTFHRGSRFRATRGARFSFHNVYRAAGCDWMGWRAFPREGPRAEMTRFVERVSASQRSLLGFPAPGHPYWTEQTLAGVALRYPAMDVTPYRQALERARAVRAAEAEPAGVGAD